MSTETIDLRGMGCPIPQMKTRQALKRVAIGATVSVRVDSEDAVKDIRALVKSSKHRLVSETLNGAKPHDMTFVIERAS